MERVAVRRALELRSEGIGQKDIAETLGYSVRTIQYFLNPKWRAKKGLSNLQYGGRPERFPVTPLQQEAFDKCQIGDHSWIKDKRFDGLAFTTRSEREGQVNWERVTNGAVGTMWQTMVCYFCGFESCEHYWSRAVYVGEAPEEEISNSKV